MSITLIDLKDRIITDDGTVVVKHDFLVKKALSGEVFTNYIAVEDKDIALYNRRKGMKGGKHSIELWEDDGEVAGVPDSCYDWNIPEPYYSMDIEDYIVTKFEEKGLQGDDYEERLSKELIEIENRDMIMFIRCAIYMIDVFRKNKVVWGVGRGSSCASLVLYILDVNRVDPVKYNIPITEFFKRG